MDQPCELFPSSQGFQARPQQQRSRNQHKTDTNRRKMCLVPLERGQGAWRITKITERLRQPAKQEM